MKEKVYLAVLGLLTFIALGAHAASPYYVYRDIDLLGNATDSPNCDGDAYPCKSTLNGLPVQTRFRGTSSQLRLPQFWDETPVLFGAKIKVFNGSGGPCTFPSELPSRLNLLLGDPDTGDTVATAEVTFEAAQNEIQDVSGTISEIASLIPGKLYRISVSVGETDELLLCEAWQVGGLYLKVPVILPFIFENGFEEGQAAFWSEMYGY